MKEALLLVDLQNDYFPGGKMELNSSIGAVNNAAIVLEKFRNKQLPIIHIQHISVHPTATFFLPDTDGINIHIAVAPLPGEQIFQKNFPNSFCRTPLLNYLRENNIKKLYICGMMTHMCIDATTRAAFDYEFECIVINNACTTKALTFNGQTVPAEHVQNAFMAALGSVYAKIYPADKVIDIINS
ncbi:MAG: cysteine hydrolase family protein [bacterium]